MISHRMIKFALLLLCRQLFAANPQAIEVCAGCQYTSLKAAITAAAVGATVKVKEGTYKESEILIDKTLSLVTEGKVIVDAGGQGHAFVLFKTKNVSISGFTIQNTGMSYTKELSGVRVIESKDCNITSNTFLNTTYAVYLENSEACLVADNLIAGHAVDEVSGGNGVHVWYGGSHKIERNQISGHRDGIYLEFATGTQIRENRVKQNVRYGLHFMFSSKTQYHKNIFTENGAGVAVMYSRQIKMYDNKFIGNTGPAAYGLLLKEIQESEIFNNEFKKNTVAIYMEGSNRSSFQKNEISDNGWALRIMGDCENNSFTQNNFIGNTFDVTTNSDHNWNSLNENYWSQYDGYDLNRDGYGDKPYRAVSLSSVILEKIDSSYILMNSFFFNLMDQVERALPNLTPESIKDEKPLMTPANAGVRL